MASVITVSDGERTYSASSSTQWLMATKTNSMPSLSTQWLMATRPIPCRHCQHSGWWQKDQFHAVIVNTVVDGNKTNFMPSLSTNLRLRQSRRWTSTWRQTAISPSPRRVLKLWLRRKRTNSMTDLIKLTLRRLCQRGGLWKKNNSMTSFNM